MVPPPVVDPAGAVFEALLDIVEEARAAARAEWGSARHVWLPLQYALRPEDHDSQAELDAVLARATGAPFHDGNMVSYLINEQFQWQLHRTIHAARDCHVLQVHDFRGRDDHGAPDAMSFRHVLRSYVAAMTERVRAYDSTGTFPTYLILLDQYFYEARSSRLWMDLLERPLDHRVSLPPPFAAWQDSLVAAQQALRDAMAGSAKLTAQRAQFGEAWLRNMIKVHVNITNVASPTFFSWRLATGLPVPDNITRDHRKIAFYDITEAVRERVLFYTLLGSTNQNARGVSTDGEVMLALSGWTAVTPMLDLLSIIGQSRWVESRAELDRLLPPRSALVARVSHWLKAVFWEGLWRGTTPRRQGGGDQGGAVAASSFLIPSSLFPRGSCCRPRFPIHHSPLRGPRSTFSDAAPFRIPRFNLDARMSWKPQRQQWPGRRALLLVHGIGNAHEGDYTELLARVRHALGDMADDVAIYQLWYDQINDWFAAKNNLGDLFTQAITALRREIDDDDLGPALADVLGDVLWPVLVSDARAAVREAYLYQLKAMVQDGVAAGIAPSDQRLSIICHSLGCFHTYEALHHAARYPSHELQPATHGVRFENVIFMASPVMLIRSVAMAMGGLVPNRQWLYTIKDDALSVPGETTLFGEHVRSVERWISITGALDPVGGHFFRKAAPWAVMRVAGEPDPIVVDQQALNINTKAELVATLKASLRDREPPHIAANNPHSWEAYVDAEAEQIRGWLA